MGDIGDFGGFQEVSKVFPGHFREFRVSGGVLREFYGVSQSFKGIQRRFKSVSGEFYGI